jgi:hypothetical protein
MEIVYLTNVTDVCEQTAVNRSFIFAVTRLFRFHLVIHILDAFELMKTKFDQQNNIQEAKVTRLPRAVKRSNVVTTMTS